MKIYDLALKMINLSGLKLKNKSNPYGDIEIIFSGLRPCEELYEDFLIDNLSSKTSHPLIYRAKERFVMPEKIFPLIKE